MKTIDAVINFFEKAGNADCEIHALTVYRGGKKIFSGAPAPYAPDYKNHVYSLSKSFCSTAVGIACDKGYLSLDEKIIDIFPEKCPQKISENLSKMTLKNVLSMNTGHAACIMSEMVKAKDPVLCFMNSNIEYEPGTHFAYNTGATFLASACVTKRTGMSVLDFLELNLFRHMDIETSEWNSHAGISEGGVGFHVSCEDAAKLGLLYLGKGIYNGRRLLSEEYVKLASSSISDNSGNGSPDWCAGYGLQFWQNARGGFRGDGAFGQLCMIFPEKDVVVAAIAECGNMQAEVDCVYDFLNELDSCGSFSEENDEKCGSAEKEFYEKFYAPSEFSANDIAFAEKVYAFEQNICGFTLLRTEKSENGLNIYFSVEGTRIYKITVVSGKWIYGTLGGNFVKPMLDGFTATHGGELKFAASARTDDGELFLTLRALNCPHRITYKFEADGDNIKITRDGNKNGGHAAVFTGKEIR